MSDIESLRTFRDLSSDPKNHPRLLKEKKIILYAATLLDNLNNEVLHLCLDIIENFVANEDAHSFLISTFGVYEALEALSIRVRNKNEKLYQRSAEIIDILRSSTPPAYNTRNRTKMSTTKKRQQLFTLFIKDLNQKNIIKLEQVLLKIRGIISFIIDKEMHRCTVRICPKTEIKDVIEKVFSKASLKALVVTKNLATGEEEVKDVTRISLNESYLGYSEDSYSPKNSAITAKNLMQNGNDLLKSLVTMWNDAFYW